jgi:gluconate 5-dehydrogenase
MGEMGTLDAFSLKDKVAIVTGSSYGIGFDMAEGLAEAGANIVVCARNLTKCEEAAQELGKLGIKTLALKCDVTVPEDVDQMVTSTVSEFGKIDILVNNAGGAGERAAPEHTSLDNWNRVLNTDLTSLLICIKVVGPEMIKQSSGKIINITSVFGRAGSDIVDDIAYHAAKAGAENFTRALALKWAKHNINVNGIAPGFFPTPMAKELLDDIGDEVARLTPLGRLGRGHDLKGVVVFLSSSSSDFITGEIVCVDGGWMIRGSGIHRAVVS